MAPCSVRLRRIQPWLAEPGYVRSTKAGRSNLGRPRDGWKQMSHAFGLGKVHRGHHHPRITRPSSSSGGSPGAWGPDAARIETPSSTWLWPGDALYSGQPLDGNDNLRCPRQGSPCVYFVPQARKHPISGRGNLITSRALRLKLQLP